MKRLLIANTAVWVVDAVLGLFHYGGLVQWALAFVPAATLYRPWTILTYMFVHGSFFHLLFNMLGLFFFGPQLEERWGSREFIKFYLIAGLGGALLSCLMPRVPIIGASAAVYGVMLAYAMYWPDNQVYIYGIFPVKVKWLVAAIVVISIFSALSPSGGGGVAHLAHLGGFATAFLYLKSPWAPSAWGPSISTPKKPRARAKAKTGLAAHWPGQAASKPAAPQNPPGATRTRPDEQALLDDVDRILEKISARGLGSLTDEERQRLDEVSRRYRSN
ncbi:MAG: rhomboid family intramembrane serine protease [Gemmatimonadetes bacterium]|nr:rhomboid family intramembrane serine protease [Gemmatimonadota bacterium]